MRRTSRPEQELQRAVVQYLARALPASAVLHHSHNNARSAIAGGIARSMGARAGWPDLEIIWEGRAYFIELKAPRGVVRKRQRECHDDLRFAGAKVAVCTSLEGVAANLREWGFNLSARLT